MDHSLVRAEVAARLADESALTRLPAEEQAQLLATLAECDLFLGDRDAAPAAARVIELAPQWERGWQLLAWAHHRAGRWTELRDHTMQAGQRFRSASWVFAERLHAHRQLGEIEPGIKAGLGALSLDRKQPSVWEDLGWLWWSYGALEQVEQSAMALRELGGSPSAAAALELRASAARGDHARVTASGESVVAQRPDDLELRWLVGCSLLALGQIERAQDAARELLLRAPQSSTPSSMRVQGLTLLMTAHALQRDYHAAAETAEQAIAHSPAPAPLDLWDALLTHRLAAREVPAAIEAAQRAAQAHPTAASLWHLLSIALEQGSRPEAALAAGRLACLLSPEQAELKAQELRLSQLCALTEEPHRAERAERACSEAQAGRWNQALAAVLS